MTPLRFREIRGLLAFIPVTLGVLSGCSVAVAISIYSSWLWAILLAVLAIVFIVSAALVAGRHPVVIYLRKFGSRDATERFGDDFATELSRSFRIVALSDPATNPVVAHGSHAIIYALVWAGATAIVLLISKIAPIPVALFIMIAIALSNLAAARLHKRVKRYLATRPSAMIETVADLDAAEVSARKWRTFSVQSYLPPRHVEVIRVVLALWQPTVSRLARHADAVLIDISELGLGLTWELETLHKLCSERLVIVAASSSEALARGESSLTPAGTDASAIQILRNYPILVSTDGVSSAKFARICRDALWSATKRATGQHHHAGAAGRSAA